jgi:hypothetical protein
MKIDGDGRLLSLWVAAALLLAVAPQSTRANVLFKFTFDSTPVQDPGPSNATFGAGDSVVGGGTFWRLGAGHWGEAAGTANAIVPAGADAWQGGNALKSSSNLRSGYKLDGCSGQIEIDHTTPSRKRGWTYEVLAKFTAQSPAYFVTMNQDGWQKYPALQVKRTSATDLAFSAGAWLGTGGAWIQADTASLPVLDSQWHHIASTLQTTSDTTATMRVYVDGVLQATNTGLVYSGFFYMNVNGVAANAGQYQHNEVVTGMWVDAVALSDEPLEPAAFVLPTAPPPAQGTVIIIH